MSELLRLEAVHKSYGSLKVIHDLSLSLGEGEALGVIGPNGAGKSTMFNLIAGGVRPSQGRIHLSGRDITAASAPTRCLLGIGRSYQIPRPFVGMTVFENLLVAGQFGARLSARAAEALALDVLEKTGLLHRANLPAGRLTLLDRKRLELARAMATRPRLLLLDEIAGGLTDAECTALVRTINDLRGTGVSIIWIEHVVHALMAVVDRLMALNFGQLIAEGEPQAVMNSPDVRQIYMGIDAHA